MKLVKLEVIEDFGDHRVLYRNPETEIRYFQDGEYVSALYPGSKEFGPPERWNKLAESPVIGMRENLYVSKEEQMDVAL